VLIRGIQTQPSFEATQVNTKSLNLKGNRIMEANEVSVHQELVTDAEPLTEATASAEATLEPCPVSFPRLLWVHAIAAKNDGTRSVVAVSKVTALAGAAVAIAVVDKLAKCTRSVSERCDHWSERMRSHILNG
jgi:hypothetical protein